jgi:predicted MFS family arabinose efflux permease
VVEKQQERASPAAWYGLGVLFVAYTFSFIDRSILSLMVEPIKADLGLNDTQVSLLHGLAFAIFYTLLGIPIARLADRRSRKHIIALGIVLWSLMTVACGLAERFLTLFLARVGVGVGEAALSPAAYSMLTDLFPKRQLGLAMSLYSAGVYVGAGMAFVVGGLAVAAAERHGPIAVPVIGNLEPWQMIFFIVGAPGLLVALLMLSVREPKRRGPEVVGGGQGLGEVFAFIRSEPRGFLAHFAGFSILGLLFNGFLAWTPVYFMRKFEMSPGDVGPLLGSLIFVFGSLGIVAGGIYSDRLIKRGDPAGALTAAGHAGWILFPICVVTPLLSSFELNVVLFAAFFAFAAFPYGAAAAALQMAAPAGLRAQTSAVYLFVLNLTGIGLGPTAVALITDFGLGNPAMVGTSMAIVGAIAAPIGAIILLAGRKHFAASVTARSCEG